jgi:hypothetical protein
VAFSYNVICHIFQVMIEEEICRHNCFSVKKRIFFQVVFHTQISLPNPDTDVKQFFVCNGYVSGLDPGWVEPRVGISGRANVSSGLVLDQYANVSLPIPDQNIYSLLRPGCFYASWY